MYRLAVPLIVAFALVLQGCDDGEGASGDTPSEPYTAFFTPLPTDPVYPPENPFSEAKETLGEFLFWDPILSAEMNVACASCHHPDFAWADGRTLSIGADGLGLGPDRQGEKTTQFHAPSVLNVAFTGLAHTEPDEGFVSGAYFWDLRARTLEEQAVEPVRSAVEMLGDNVTEEEIFPEIVTRLSSIPEYVMLFTAAFGDQNAITEQNIADALATFQRKLITPRTRFDDFLDGDLTTLSSREITGLNKFINGGCVDCHKGPMLSDFLIHPDRAVVRGKPAVRTQGLRNVALTPPYMHDGSRGSLRRAISIYEGRGDLGVSLDDDDFGDIAAFLRTLTAEEFYRAIPEYVPSGLSVGGDIHQ